MAASPTSSSAGSHLTHAELDAPSRLREDGEAVGRELRLDRIARAVAAGPPSITYDAFPREVAKRPIEVSDAAARIANALHLHLD
jgi:hypothetical protein